jgi:hypothetical protein
VIVSEDSGCTASSSGQRIDVPGTSQRELHPLTGAAGGLLGLVGQAGSVTSVLDSVVCGIVAKRPPCWSS